MAKLVCGIAMSHSPAAIGAPEAAGERGERFFAAQAQLKQWIAEQKIDTCVLISSDHFRIFYYKLMPTFLIGAGEVKGLGDWGIPEYEFNVERGLAKHLLENSFNEGFDFAHSLKIKLEHGHTQPIFYLDPDLKMKTVPFFINAAAPPLPTMKRCYELGKMIKSGIESWESNERVAIIASGGLSHWVPLPKVDSTNEEHQRFINIMINGRTEEESRTRTPIKPNKVNEDWDRGLLRDFEAGSLDRWIQMTTEEIERDGGNGGQEIRNWITIAAAMEGKKAETVLYEPIPEWLTGMGIMKFY